MSSVGGPGGSRPVSNVPQTDAGQKAQESQKTENPQETTSTPVSQSSDTLKVAEHKLDGYMLGVKLQAQAEREMPPMGPNQKVDITDRDWRNHMLRQAPQINPVSAKAGNGPDICGGAAMANALVMSSKTPDHAKANSQAVRDLANSFEPKVKLSPEEDAALKSMHDGRMSGTDAQHLQQVMYRIGQRMPLAGANPSGTGLSTTQVGCAMSMLAARGAFKDSDVTMHCNRNTFTNENGQPATIDHWTVTVNGNFANSQGTGNKSIVQGGPPPDRAMGTPDWQNELTLYNRNPPPEMYLQFKQPGNGPKEYHEAVVNPDNYRNPDQMLKFEDEMRKAAAARPKTMN